ncbi:hypothetical protein [Roseibium sp. TrichSKD4]|uniref:hypothetical protein n=1 Tax=Roseibium sp. TrichSKD4 TaxID=744980 RepID=UPI001AD93B6E|nr:hypothetical protein [Roseibium sp. TrichSKD4]
MVEKPSNAFLLERYRYSHDRMNRTIAAAESMIQTKKTEIEEKQVEVASVRERLFKAQKLLDKRKKLQKDFELQREQELELAEELELEDLAFQKIDMGNSQ